MKRAEVDRALGQWAEHLLYAGLRSYGQPGKDPHIRGVMNAHGAGVRARLQAIFRHAPEVSVSVIGGGSGLGAIRNHLDYVSRAGRLGVEDERGETNLGRSALRALVQEWRVAGAKIPWQSQRREAHNLVITMPRTMPRTMSHTSELEDFVHAVRQFAQAEFARYKFAMVLHEPQTDSLSNRPHVHLLVRAQGRDGERLNPCKADIARWRQVFADRLLERGIPAAATRPLTRRQLGSETWNRLGEEIASQAPQSAGSNNPPLAAAQDTWAVARNTRAQALRAWQGIALALARSDDRDDRQMALMTVRYLQGMSIDRAQRLRTLPVAAPMERTTAGHERDHSRSR